MMTRMLGKAGMRRVLIGGGKSPRRCTCDECAIEPDHSQQRAREKRQWRNEEEDVD